MRFDNRSLYLTCAEVAAKHGLSRQSVARLCRLGLILPVMKHGNAWMIDPLYSITLTAGVHGRPRVHDPRVKYLRSGRPKGAKNKLPYPKGVKRPRKKVSE